MSNGERQSLPLEVRVGDALTLLRAMPDDSVHCVVTSPPYWNLRDYGTGTWEGGDPECEHRGTNPRQDHSHGRKLGTRGVQGATLAATRPMRRRCYHCGAERVDEQLGLEETPQEYVTALVGVLREVRRVLRPEGTCWLNIGDTYNNRVVTRPSSHQEGLGFESEHLSTSWAVHAENGHARLAIADGEQVHPAGRNKRNVWTVPTQPFPGAHFATFPAKLVEPCVLAGCSPRCCGECAAPWRRVTEREDQGWDGSRYGERAVDATGGAVSGGTARSTLGSSNGKLVGRSRTVGWEPSCEHGQGLDAFEQRAILWSSGAENPGSFQRDGTERAARNHHPTVKPIELMRWLVRLVTPPGGLVLDPFVGSGTTGVACALEGFEFVGVERDPEYARIAEARIGWWLAQPAGVSIEQALASDGERRKVADAGQESLFA